MQTTLVSNGIVQETATSLINPVSVQINCISNPWMNYNYYLTNSFIPGAIALLVALVAAFTICEEMKRGTSVEWLRTAGGSMTVALFGKLLPQAIAATLTALRISALKSPPICTSASARPESNRA